MEIEPSAWYNVNVSCRGSFLLRKECRRMGKRRDHRNRVLRNGESQRKDGRYAFKYTDMTGQPQFVYSWKLEQTDKLPEGKRDCLSLREKRSRYYGISAT